MKGYNVVMAAMMALLVMASVAMAAPEKEMVIEQSRYEHQWMAQHGMDEVRIEALRSSMENGGMGTAHIGAALDTLCGAVDEGLPPEPFLRKAEEGVAKGVRGESMVKAMERVRERYRYAHTWARDLVPDDGEPAVVMETVADAMAAGMARGDLDRVRDRLRAWDKKKEKKKDKDRHKDRDKDRLGTRDRVRDPELCGETALTLREMARLRIRSRTAADAVGAALDRGYDTDEMLEFRHTFMGQMGQGDGEELMHRYTHAIRNGAPASELGTHGRNMGSGSGSGSHGGNGGSNHGTSGGGGNSGGSGSGSSGSGSGGSGSSGSGSSGSGSSGSGSSGSGSSGSGSSGSGSSGSGSSGSGSSGSGSSGSGSGGSGGRH